MGLIKAAAGAFGGTMADQWKEFFYCDAIDKDVLVVKGEKRVGGRSSNKKGSDNIISSGSGIAVADGQCMIIVEQGKVVEVCAEPGQFTYDASTEPSIFAGSLGEGIHRTFDTVKKRFTFGGDTGKDQRVYYQPKKEDCRIFMQTVSRYFLSYLFCYTNAAPKALQASVASSSGSSWQITLSHTRFAPASLQDSSQLRIHSPSPHP